MEFEITKYQEIRQEKVTGITGKSYNKYATDVVGKHVVVLKHIPTGSMAVGKGDTKSGAMIQATDKLRDMNRIGRIINS